MRTAIALYKLRWQRERAKKFYREGLTCRGAERINSQHHELRGLTGIERVRARNRNWMRRKADENRAKGLTAKGKPTKRNLTRPQLKGLRGRERENVRQKLWRAENVARGLKPNGHPYRRGQLSRVEAAYREFRKTVTAMSGELNHYVFSE